METGTLIAGRFRLGAIAGVGGMGRVFRAKDERTGDTVALKLIRGGARIVGERLAREVQVLTLLDHPGIVRYVDHGPVGLDDYFLVMEWLEGEDLAARLRRDSLSLAATLDFAERVTDALSHAHAHQVVHRDIKPANLFLPASEGGLISAKIVDFGIAKPTGWVRADDSRPGSADGTITGMPIGTVGYMAPEQARGERVIDARADVFAIGCVIFECLSGRPPFVAEHSLAVLAKNLLEEPPPLRRVSRVRVPEWLDALVAATLAKDPARRPADAGELSRALARHRDAAWEIDAQREGPFVPEILTEHERRLTSVLAVRPHPGRAETLAADTHLVEIARSFGAVLEQMVDGTYVALLRTSPSSVDSVSQAARLALALAELGAVSIATSFEDTSSQRPKSDVMDRLFRQLEQTPTGTGGALVDALTAGLIDGAFDVRRESDANWLLGPKTELDPRRPLLGRVARFVGRDQELRALLARLSDTIAEPAVSGTFVLGPAGAGKSRLRHELVRAARTAHPELRIAIVRGDPTRQASALGVMASLVMGESQLRHDDDIPARRAKLHTRLASHLAGDTLVRVAELLGELAGAPAESPSLLLQGAKDDPRRMWAETRRAFDDWLSAELAVSPWLIVVEDVQWVDAHSLHLLSDLLEKRDRPLALLGLGRPAAQSLLLAAHWQERSLQVTQLPPLGRRASEELVRDALGADVPDERVAEIAQRGAGHAFFLEELVRAEAEGHGHQTPLTVVAMLQERVERFESDARRLLRAASIFGLEFSKAGVAALTGSAGGDRAWLDRWLDSLVAREIICLAEQRRLNREETYAFRHDLIHESIYATLTDEDQQHGHLLAARWLEASHERDAAVLAEHFERGGDRASAAAAFARAAEQAFKRQDFEVALTLAERSITSGAAGPTLGGVRWVQGNIALGRRTLDDTERFSAEALDLLPEGSPQWFNAATLMVTIAGFGRQSLLGSVVGRVLQAGDPAPESLGMAPIKAWALTANMLYFAGQYPLAAEFEARIERAATRAIANESVAAAYVHFSRHVHASYCCGDPEPTVEDAQRAAALMEQAGDEILLWVRIEEAKVLGLIGDFAEAERHLQWALGVAGKDNLFPAGLARHRLARIRAWQGRFDEAVALEHDAIAHFQQVGLPIFGAVGENHLALFELDAGRLDEAESANERAHQLLFAVPPVRTYALATQARIALARGRVDSALATMKEADEALPSHGIINDGESPYDLAVVETLMAAGQREEAKRRATIAAERLNGRASRITRPEYRRSYLTVVPENARILALASDLLESP